jgi:GTPase SAR1 family protein
LVGNKTDLGDNREVLAETAKLFAEEHKLPYVETSAKTGNGVEKAFSTLVAQILEHK